MTAERLDPAEVEAFRHARDEVLGRIGAAAARAGRDATLVTLVAVSKTVPADRVRAAVAAGFRVLGENRVQEGGRQDPGGRRRRVAPHRSAPGEQGTPGGRAVRHDRIRPHARAGPAARRRRRGGSPGPGRPGPAPGQRGPGPGQGGVRPGHRGGGARGPRWARRARLPRPDDDRPVRGHRPRRPGRRSRALRVLGERLRARWPRLGPELSMGMSDDYEIAVEEGATIVRVGRAIFGERPAAPEGG